MRADPVVRSLEVTDAPALSALFTRCYGTSYGTPVFYDVPNLTRLIDEGTLRSVVAVQGETLVGHTGITIRHPGALVCETGNTVVDPALRGRGLLKQLGAALRARVVAEGFIGYVHYPTTAHPIMQRASVSGGGLETGVMLAYIAESTEYAAMERRAGRLAATVAYQPLAPAPRRAVVLPQRYAALMERIYRRCGLERVAAPDAAREDVARLAREDVARPGPTSDDDPVVASHDAARGLLRIYVARPGPAAVDEIEALIAAHAPRVIHVDLPLDDGGVDATVGRLARLGFFFCAVLPEFAHTDVLRLQALTQPAAEDLTPELVNTDARSFVEFMRHDAPW